MKHINQVILAIQAMPGPSEGELRVALTCKGNHESWGHFSPQEAIELIRGNPRIEFEATEKWLLG